MDREKLAELCHSQWSGWMEYLFDKSIQIEEGMMIIPAWAVKRWKRQAQTPYLELSEEEKESDRKEAGKIIELLSKKL